eukprot:s496_g8.t1
MPVENVLFDFADFLTAGDAVVHSHSVLGHGVDGHESVADTGSHFLALPVRGPSSGSKVAASFFELNLPKHYAKRLATKAVNKAAWFHDAVVDFQETDFFWEARRFARRHVVAEAFGLGALAGGAVRPLSSHDLPLSARLLAEKVGKQRRKAGRVYLNALTLAMAFVVASIQLNIVRDRPRWMSAPLTWSTVALTAVASLPLLVPQVFTPGSLDVFYVAVMLIAAAVLTPPVCPLDQLQLLVLLINAVIRFPAVCLCTRVSLLVVLNCISSGVVLLRVLIEDFDTETGCSQRAPYVIMWTELVCFVVNVGMGGGLEVFLKQNVVQDLKYSRVTEELSAATALLRLTCDAVVELDEDLRLTEHSKELAAILLRDRPGSTLAGVRFADFVATSEEASRVIDFLTAEDIFNGKQEGFSAHACHTRLADSCHSKFRTEVFQVKYRKQDGQLSHLLGLRDFTDQDALTGPQAPTADVDQEDNFTKIRSCRRSQNLPATGGQVVDAASILASSLETGLKVGMSLPELFPGAGWQAIETFANDVVEKWMAQDIGSMARKIHRFERYFA